MNESIFNRKEKQQQSQSLPVCYKANYNKKETIINYTSPQLKQISNSFFDSHCPAFSHVTMYHIYMTGLRKLEALHLDYIHFNESILLQSLAALPSLRNLSTVWSSFNLTGIGQGQLLIFFCSLQLACFV